MAAVLSASALLLGALAERVRRLGMPTELFLAGTLALSMAAQLALLLGVPVPSQLLFAVIAAAGATSVLSFAVLARYFPKEVAGRANAALGVLNMGSAFALQSLAGFIIALWPASEGRYPVEAHQAALAIGVTLQLAALCWFAAPRQRSLLVMQHAVARLTLLKQPQPASLQYRVTIPVRSARFTPAQRQPLPRLRAAAASAPVSVALALLFTLPAAREGQRHVVEAAPCDPVEADPPRARPGWGHFSPTRPAQTEVPKWQPADQDVCKP